MAAKVGGYMGKLLAVVFTSVVAPVLVDVAVHDLHGEPDRPTAPAAPSAVWQAPQAVSPADTAARPDEVACVVAQGVGPTPEEALRNALRAALWRAVAARVDAETWNRNGQALFENLWRDSRELILSWKELAARKEWRLRGNLHHEELAVTLNCRLLTDRLRAVQTLGWNRVAQAPQ
jgi:hypothetical protein